MVVMGMKVDKFRNKAAIMLGDGKKLEVNFFLSYHSAMHSGSETIFDVLNSKALFIPLEDTQTSEVIFVAKGQLMYVELLDREVVSSLYLRELQIQVELLNGEVIEGEILIDMPQTKPRLSDFLNLPHEVLYLHREGCDTIINKRYISLLKEK